MFISIFIQMTENAQLLAFIQMDQMVYRCRKTTPLYGLWSHNISHLNSNAFFVVDCYQKEFTLDNDTATNTSPRLYKSLDSGTNIGADLPVKSSNLCLSIGAIQILCGLSESEEYYIRCYWGKWRSWHKL